MDALSRRELLQRGAVGAAALILARGAIACGGEDDSGPRIVIVGAGLAGLSCAYRLQRHGYASSVYEANPDRIGGRCWTAREFDGDQTAEHGGEFVDSRHLRFRNLAEEFGLEDVDLYDVPNPGGPRLWLDGQRRYQAELREERRMLQRRIRAAADEIGEYDYPNATRAAKAFDELSVADWLNANLPGGRDSLEGRLVSVEMASEFGLDPERLSALNLIFEYAEPAPGADERYRLRGGNDQLPHALAAALPDGTVKPGAALDALFERGDGSYGLRFSGAPTKAVADLVVLAIPFTTLRRVDLSQAGLSARKRRCIEELGMGTNAKVLMQFDQRPQAYGDWNGYALSDDPYLLTWESTLGEPGESSIMTTFFGGRSGAEDLTAPTPHGPTVASEIDRNLSSLEQGGGLELDGLSGGFNGRAWTDHWAADPWALGSYAAYEPGQYTRYFGYAAKPEGGIHFAGEQTATVNQGYLEGAIESGERAAEELVARAER